MTSISRISEKTKYEIEEDKEKSNIMKKVDVEYV